MRYFFLTLFLLLFSFFLIEYKIVGQAVYGDGRYYWAFTRSLYFSQNIEVSDEMHHFYSPENNNKEVFFGVVPEYLDQTRFITAGFSLGMSVIWLPFYFLSDAFVVLLSSLGIHTVRNGYSDIYQVGVAIQNILFVVLGLYLVGRVLKKWYTDQTIILGMVLLFSTNLFYYSALDPINSHPFSFFLSCLLIWSLIIYKEKKHWGYVILQGISIGLLAGNRTQDVLFLVLPLIAVFLERRKEILTLSKEYVVLGCGVLIGYLPQLVLLSVGQGRFEFIAHVPKETPAAAFGLPTYMLQIIFDQKLGVLYYMPALFIGIAGLLLLMKKRKALALMFLFGFFLQFLLISSWHGWSQVSYSMRYFVSSLPFLLFGIIESIVYLQKRFSKTFIIVLIALFLFHQLTMIVGYKLFWQDPTMVGSELSRSGILKKELLLHIEKVLP